MSIPWMQPCAKIGSVDEYFGVLGRERLIVTLKIKIK